MAAIGHLIYDLMDSLLSEVNKKKVQDTIGVLLDLSKGEGSTSTASSRSESRAEQGGACVGSSVSGASSSSNSQGVGSSVSGTSNSSNSSVASGKYIGC